MQEAPPAAHPLETRPSDLFTPKYMDRLLSEFRDQPSQFEEKVNEYVALNWPHLAREASFEDALIQFDHLQPDGEIQMRAVSPRFKERQTKIDPSWNQLVDCFNSALRRDQIIYNLEIPPGNGGATPFRETVLQSIEEEQEIAEPEQNQSETILSGSDSDFYPAEISTASLMGGVDLHLELQNYLKAIEGFQTAKTKTKNTLQCNFYDNYVPLKLYSSSQDLQKRAEEYFDVAENRSGTSFDSATSDCPQLEEVTNEMLLNVTAMTGPEPTARKADPGKQQQQQKSNNSIKRTAGITSFKVFKLNDKTTWGPSYLHGECIKGGLSHDDYEKIQPLGAAVTRRKGKTGWLFQDPVTQTEQPPESAPGGESSNPQDQTPPWSPTLQELIDIYNSVLKQNTKIKRSSKQSVQRCFSTHLFTFLNEKLQERHYKSGLLNLSKDFRIDCKTLTKLGKPVKNNNDLMKLEEYVGMFQEILHSSLSIHQITRLNNMLAGLQDYSQKNYNYVKDLKEGAKKQPKEPSPVPEEKRVPSPKVQARPRTAPRKPTKTVRFETPQKPVKQVPRTPRPTTAERKIRKQQKPRKPKPKPVKPPVLEKIEKTEFSAPAELESILKLCSKGIVLEKQDMEEKRKILVTVKLHGNQVLVNGISCFDSESALMNEKPDSKGTSELIIENVTRRKMSSDVWWKNTKSSRLRIQNQENTRKRLKKPKKLTTRVWKRSKSMESDSELSEQDKSKQEFEYDQARLRVQHPIDAIAEISESKVSQQVETLEEQRKGEPPPETKILLQDIPDSPQAMKEALKAVLDQKVFTKDLIWDFGWSEEELGKTVTRKRSFRSKRRPTPKKSKHAVEVKSLGDLKKKQTSTKTKGQKPPRRGRTYLCYSALQSIQGKASRKTQRQTTRNGSPAKARKNKDVCDKESKETQLSEKKSEPVPSVLFTTTALVKPQSSVDISTNSDEVEFIFTEEQPDARATVQESQTIASFGSAASLEKADSFLTAEKESSIALLQSSPCNDCVSILHEMNHSDSFLGNIPTHAVSYSKLQSVFKCSSDLKFYPGRVTENGTGEENPIVTFVLTPSQHEQAQLPENQVKIVKKDGTGSPRVIEKKKEENPEPSTEEGRDEMSLKSIEEFINYLSQCRKLTDSNRKKRSKPQPGEKKLESSSAKCCAGNKTPATTNRLSGSSLPSYRKGFHECQKKAPSEGNKKKPEKPVPVPKQRPKPKKKPESPNTVLNKLVENLSRALENFRKEKLMKQEESQKVETAKPSENREAKETKTESKRGNTPVESVKPAEIPPGVVEAIKIAITQTEGSGEKQEINAEIGDGVSKGTQNVGTTCEEAPKKVKALKIKIHCNETKQPLDNVEGVQPPPQVKEVQPVGEIELLDSLVSRDTEGGDLKRQNSTYFDAVEKNVEVKMSGDTNNQPPVEGKLDLNMEFGVKEQPKHTLFTPSDEQLLSREVLGKNSEEVIYNKIAKSFQEGQVTYSMALLEAFLSKADDSDCIRLRKLLALIETRSRNIMMNMERAAWQKVLSLLEEVSQVVGKDDVRDSMNAQLETAKHFIDKIQLLNTKRLIDLENFCSSFISSPQEDDTHGSNVMDRIKQSLKLLKDKFTLQRNNPSRNLENMDRSELTDTVSGFKIHSTVSLPEIRQDKVTRADNVKDAEELKRMLQQRYFCMQELLSGRDKSESNIPQEIQDVRDRVAEKIKLLETALEGDSVEAASRESATYWNKATSLLKLATGCRRGEGGSTVRGEVSLSRRPGYVDLMKCLMKAWDTRMTIGSIKSECFG